MFSFHPNTQAFTMYVPYFDDTVDGHTITILGGFASGSASTVLLKTRGGDYNPHPEHMFSESGTYGPGYSITIPLNQTRTVCVYNKAGGLPSPNTKWWVYT